MRFLRKGYQDQNLKFIEQYNCYIYKIGKFKLKVNYEYEENKMFYLFGSFFDQVILVDYLDRYMKIYQVLKDISGCSFYCLFCIVGFLKCN